MTTALSQPLGPAEEQALASYRFWNNWVTQNIPPAFISGAEDRNLVIHALQHFVHTEGSATYVGQEGWLLLALDEPARLLEQLRGMIRHNLKGLYILTSPTPVDVGGTPRRLKLTRLKLADQLKNPALDFASPQKREAVWKELRRRAPGFAVEDFLKLSRRLERDFLEDSGARFIADNLLLFHQARSDINIKLELQALDPPRPGLLCITVASRRTSQTGFVFNHVQVLHRFGLDIEELRTIYVPEGQDDDAALLHFIVRERGDQAEQTSLMNRLMESLSMVQWVEFENPMNQEFLFKLDFSIHHTLFLRSIEVFLYQMLVEVDASLHTPENIHDSFARYPDVCRALVEYFSHRFNPVRHQLGRQEELRQKALDLIAGLDSGIPDNDERRKTVLRHAVDFIAAIQKTNYYVIRRSALSYRLDPAILERMPFDRKALYPELPFSIFFIKGKNFFAFNVRFRDLSRGGVRTLLPRDSEQLMHLQTTVFRECYNLALTQQKKNKDIPEGGSKSVIFVKPYRALDRELNLSRQTLERRGDSRGTLALLLKDHRAGLLRQQLFDAQRSFCDALLDLVIWNGRHKRLEKEVVVDLYGREELIFLGPDENMTDEMIEWMSSRSAERGYSVGAAFMSGKKGAGINHKAYGVTSLGVHVYVLEALKAVGLDPAAGFSVKMAGGPDGDVAGNEIMNLVREPAGRARLLAIVDGTALIHDPQGLDPGELTRLFKAQQGVSGFNPSRLHPDSFLLSVHERREVRPGSEEVQRRFTVADGRGVAVREEWIGASHANHLYSHFLHQLSADVFLPCGGRPRTLNDRNWRDFLKPDGTPAARIIVEGANLYLSNEARAALSAKGALIIKDASANKCGVICSSYEVQAGLLISEQEFARIKEDFVAEVLEILRLRALSEARLLLREWKNSGRSLIELSDRVNDRINEYTDLILANMAELRRRRDIAPLLDRALRGYIPAVLRRAAGSRIRGLPQIYRDCVVACAIAAQLIYKKGLDYQPSILDAIGLEIRKGLLTGGADDP